MNVNVGAVVTTPVSPSARNWRFECPPTLETGCALCANNKHRAKLAVKVTPSPLKSVGGPGGKNNSERPIMTEDRSTGGLALPGDYPSTGPIPIRMVWWLGSL